MNNENRLTHRFYSTEFRTDDAVEGVIEGVPIVFNKETIIHDLVGDFREIIMPGALDKTDMRDVLLFVNHDEYKLPLARSRKGRSDSTMKCEVKEDGLHIRAGLDIANNTDAKNLFSAIKRGDIDGMSFAFRVDNDEWQDMDKDVPIRYIKSISIVHEVSCVHSPAYNQTSVTARSNAEADFSVLAEARQRTAEETARRNKEACEMIRIKTRSKL